MRHVKAVYNSQYVIEGAGVKLKRVFGYYEKPDFDPFLLLDHFGSHDPKDYMKGFPWHPHRGIETVTYLLSGAVRHGDSMGNKGAIEAGDLQWMSAGSGIIHEEMPVLRDDPLEGFQLWINMPAKEKMSVPRYRGITSDQVGIAEDGSGPVVRVIAGEYEGIKGPVSELTSDFNYYDISLPESGNIAINTNDEMNLFAYVYRGSGYFCESADLISQGQAVIFGKGNMINITGGIKGTALLIVGGYSLNEPIAWKGPIVMNTDRELEEAFSEYRNGTFIKSSGLG